TGETVHIDATLIRANASMESVTRSHADAVWSANTSPPNDQPPDPQPGGQPTQGKESVARATLRSSTDPDATVAKGAFGQPARPRYKQHTAVDGKAQIIVDVALTTGIVPEERELLPQL